MMVVIALIALVGSIQFPFDHHNVCKGYGDYNAGAGFHQGMDFQSPDPDEWAYSPYSGTSKTAISIFSHEDAVRNDWVVLLARDSTCSTGWSYQHMLESVTDQYVEGTWFDETIGKIAPYPDLGSHIHVGWLDKANLIGGTFYQPGCFNPFDSLQTPPGYNDAPILTELHEISSLVGTGLMVYEDYSLPQTYSDASVLQGVVYGIVDFAVSPASSFNGDPASDSCGVRRLSHRLLQQDPYTGSYEALSEYSWRTLFDMSGYFPDISMPSGPGSSLAFQWLHYLSEHYNNRYLLTHCGLETVSGDTCLTNVWTEAYDRAQDWADGEFCRGAFDTRLGISSQNAESWTNETAMFPDGKYCVEVRAVSQGSQQDSTWRLPVFDITQPQEPGNIKGLVVDNFRPNVDSVFVYHAPDYDSIYTGGWQTLHSSYTRELDEDASKYLPIGQNNLCVAVKFSEPMDSLPDVWITGEWRGETGWSSVEEGRNAWFVPCDWDATNLGPMPETDDGSFWQCYRNGMCFSDYKGILTLHIGDNLSCPVGGPGEDLAGNQLDGDPSSVCGPRQPFPSTDWEDWGGYETGDDGSYSWGGAPDYRRISSSLVRGIYSNYSLEVDLPSSVQEALFVGDCPYWCGFWMIDTTPSDIDSTDYSTYPVYLFDFEASYETLHGMTPNGLVETVDFPPDSGEAAASCIGDIELGCNNDYLWVAVNSAEREYDPDTDYIGSSSGIVHLFSDDEEYYEFDVVSGWWWPGFVGDYNASSVCSITADTDSDSVMVIYGFGTWPPDPDPYSGVDTTYLEPPESLAEVGGVSEDVESQSDTQGLGEQQFEFRLMDNPCYGSIRFEAFGHVGEGIRLRVYDLSGRVIADERSLFTNGRMTGEITLESAPTGLLLVVSESGGDCEKRKVTILN